MPDALARRMADNQVSMYAASLARDAERFAMQARHFAHAGKDGGQQTGAFQLAQAALDLLRQASRLDGMRDIAALVPDTQED